MMKSYIVCIIIIISFVYNTFGQDCKAKSNTSCAACLDVNGCAYCKDSKNCFVTPSNPLDAPCSASNLQIKTCFADTQTLAIVLGSVGGVILLFILILICCLCRKCKQRELRKLEKTQNKNERQLEERRTAAAARTAERNEKNDQIRIKYGLPMGNDTSVGYRRMN